MLFGQEHVEKYRETGGEVGHEWHDGVYTLLLTTTGRKTGNEVTTPLIYGRDGTDYVVIASKGGADDHPDWFLNLEADPEVTIQVRDQVMSATAERANQSDKGRIWPMMTDIWPDYDDYKQATTRDIPVVVIHPHD